MAINPRGDVIFKARVDGGHVEYRGALTLGAMAMIEQLCLDKAVFVDETGKAKKFSFWEVAKTLDDVQTCSHIALMIVVMSMINAADDKQNLSFEQACLLKIDFVGAVQAIIEAVQAIHMSAEQESAKKKTIKSEV